MWACGRGRPGSTAPGWWRRKPPPGTRWCVVSTLDVPRLDMKPPARADAEPAAFRLLQQHDADHGGDHHEMNHDNDGLHELCSMISGERAPRRSVPVSYRVSRARLHDPPRDFHQRRWRDYCRNRAEIRAADLLKCRGYARDAPATSHREPILQHRCDEAICVAPADIQPDQLASRARSARRPWSSATRMSAMPVLLDRERIGAQHGEVGELARLRASPSCPRRR